MKKRFITIGLILLLPVSGAILLGCSSPANSEFILSTPGCTATWDVNTTWVAWSKVEGADYYIIYGKQFALGGEPPPSDPHTFLELYKTLENEKSPFKHDTPDDFSYAVRAFTNSGESSDFSNVAFTW